jgi:hypothetical protein
MMQGMQESFNSLSLINVALHIESVWKRGLLCDGIHILHFVTDVCTMTHMPHDLCLQEYIVGTMFDTFVSCRLRVSDF